MVGEVGLAFSVSVQALGLVGVSAMVVEFVGFECLFEMLRVVNGGRGGL